MLTLKQRQERAARRAARIAARHEAIRQAACQDKEGSTIMKKTGTKVAGTKKAPATPTSAHGAAGKAPAGKDAKAAKGAKPAATALAEDKLSPGAKADLAKVREAATKPDPALDKALADAGKAKAEKKARAKGPKKASLLDLAAEVLAKAGKPMGCKEIVEQVLKGGQWQTKGKTPAATLYSAIIREIATKGKASRFRKTDRGQFAATGTKDA
jgi:hypothetical protein